MKRPDIERFERMAAGRDGWAIARTMQQYGFDELVAYINYLEKKEQGNAERAA